MTGCYFPPPQMAIANCKTPGSNSTNAGRSFNIVKREAFRPGLFSGTAVSRAPVAELKNTTQKQHGSLKIWELRKTQGDQYIYLSISPQCVTRPNAYHGSSLPSRCQNFPVSSRPVFFTTFHSPAAASSGSTTPGIFQISAFKFVLVKPGWRHGDNDIMLLQLYRKRLEEGVHRGLGSAIGVVTA